ncbi:hypothetical protein [Micromonospora sp. NPDC050695]|uniref:hypothetical protein n=1 Tax=Micromonospora sp. NPDC050695 TaxID=3154938 RepID=UPI0033CFF9C7
MERQRKYRIGDRVYHRTRREWGVYGGVTSDPGVAFVTFESEPEALKVSKHLLDSAAPAKD